MNTKVIALLEEALRLLKQPEGPSARDIALAKIGTHVETAYLVVQIHGKGLNQNGRGGTITYSHPRENFTTPVEKKDYFVSADKLDITIWDEVDDNKFYLIESHKFTKPGRTKDRWVWMSVAELDEQVARKCPGYSKQIPKNIIQWSNENN